MGYHPGLGVWVERDPKGYVDGPNVYQYEMSNPANNLDPFGLSTDINTFNEGLAHYYSGGGADVTWGETAINGIKRNYKYRWMIGHLLEDAARIAGCSDGSYQNQYKFGKDEVSMMPHKNAIDGGSILGWWSEWLGNWNSGLLIGTLNYLDAWGDYKYSAKKLDDCSCEVTVTYSIRVEASDDYDFRGIHNAPVKYVIVNPIALFVTNPLQLSGGHDYGQVGMAYTASATWYETGSFTVKVSDKKT